MPQASSRIKFDSYSVDANVEAGYAYPEGTVWAPLGHGTTVIHVIIKDADPNADTTYDAAPLGSLFIRTTTGSVTHYRKTDATTWTASSS